MYIVSMTGEVLAEFNKWDVRTVGMAERWITDNGYVIFKCEMTILGTYVVTVRSV